MKTGAAFNQQNDYRPSVSNVKGILQKKCRKNPYFTPQDELFRSELAPPTKSTNEERGGSV
jgi:hypothetical protein